jgi:hypothetical protein
VVYKIIYNQVFIREKTNEKIISPVLFYQRKKGEIKKGKLSFHIFIYFLKIFVGKGGEIWKKRKKKKENQGKTCR